MPVSGNLTEISVSHPDVGDAVFFVTPGTDSNYNLGGLTSEDTEEGVDSGGRTILKKTFKRWSFETSISWDQTTDELGILQSLSDSTVEGIYTFTHINGTVYKGKGSVVGPIVGNGMSATIPIKFAGGGSLEKIS